MRVESIYSRHILKMSNGVKYKFFVANHLGMLKSKDYKVVSFQEV